MAIHPPTTFDCVSPFWTKASIEKTQRVSPKGPATVAGGCTLKPNRTGSIPLDGELENHPKS